MNEHEPTVVVQPTQGVVSVAADTINALKASPVLLLVVLLNCAFIGGAAWYLRTQQDNVTKAIMQILDRCLPAHQ